MVHVEQAKRETFLTIRVTRTSRDWITEQAQRADVDLSRFVRRMLTYAAMNMPTGWTPPDTELKGRR